MNLSDILRSDKDARKIFGQRELKIIEKQLHGIDLSQSEKNRLSRDIRKKFDFISKVARFEAEFRLKKGAEVKKRIDEVKEIILKDPLYSRIKSIRLFGSTVEKKLTFRSDIDISVRFDKISIKDATLFRKRVLGRSPEKADVQVYNVLPDKIKDEIDKKGRVLYEQ